MQPDFQQIFISSVQHGMRSWADAKWASEPAGASSGGVALSRFRAQEPQPHAGVSLWLTRWTYWWR